MSDHKYILQGYETIGKMLFGAKFFRADLHFHTPASEDARGKNKYNFNPYKQKYPANDDSTAYHKKVNDIQAEILFEARRVAQNIVKKFIEVDLSMVAVTDHNSIGTIWNDCEGDNRLMDLAAPTWYELIDNEAARINLESGEQKLTILPGVEISTTGIHLLAVFPPQTPRRKSHFIICDLLNQIGFDIDEWGKNPKVGSSSLPDAIRFVIQRGGIPIPAHIDGSSQALLDLYKINSGAMKNVLSNEHLSGVEIVRPAKFTRKDKKLKKPLKQWIDTLRQENGLSSLSYLQGSDAHDLEGIGKRHTYIKMTQPSFSGLKAALQMPSSRVRISDLYQKSGSGLFIYGLCIENSYFGKRCLRFNRHLNCIIGKKGAGKSGLCALMQASAHQGHPLNDGKITMYMENIADGSSTFYVFHRSSDPAANKCFAFDLENRRVDEIDKTSAGIQKVVPKFYEADKIEEIVLSGQKLDAFLKKHFGNPTRKNLAQFNKNFSIPDFLEKKHRQLLMAESKDGRYKLFINLGWASGKQKMKDILRLSHSLRKAAMLCIIIILSRFGPSIIDAPEADFDNEDIINYLVPVIKKYKDSQQIILFTNNPIFAVNADPDNYILLDSDGTKLKDITSGFAIDDQQLRPSLLNIVEGGLGSFHSRAARYEL